MITKQRITIFFLVVVILLVVSAPLRAEPPPMPMPWIAFCEPHYTPSQVRLYNPGIVTVPWGDPTTQPPPFVPNTWYTVDVTPYGIPADAVVMFLSGLGVITAVDSLNGMTVTFREWNDPAASVSKYLSQVGPSSTRSGSATFVPLRQGKFDFAFQAQTPNSPPWPVHSDYVFNFTVQFWAKACN